VKYRREKNWNRDCSDNQKMLADEIVNDINLWFVSWHVITRKGSLYLSLFFRQEPFCETRDTRAYEVRRMIA